MSAVVSLYGEPVAPGMASEGVVELLERYLDQAKRGEITGLAVA
jgi:hypothetical protein